VKEYSFGHMPSLFKNGNTGAYPHFLTLTDRLNLKNAHADSTISFLRNLHPDGFPNMITIQITEVKVLSITNSLKTKNLSGYKKISNKIFKLCGPLVRNPLSYIYNKSVSVGIFSDHLKYDKSYIANYRSLSIMTAFSKLFELTVFHRFASSK
jgi:hypothetical protein